MKISVGKGQVIFLRKKVLFFVVTCFIIGILTWMARKNKELTESSFDTFPKLRTKYISLEKDWFERNITRFEKWQHKTNLNFTLFRQATIKTEGDFSCSSSEVFGSCAFKVDRIIQGISLCNRYGPVCVGFVLTKGMKVYLKHRVRSLHFDNEAASFIRQSYLKKLEK